MKLSVEIIRIIIIGIIILYQYCSEIEYFADVAGTTIAGADIDSIRNLNSFASLLMKPNGTLTNPGNLKVIDKLTVGGVDTTFAKVNIDNGDGNYTHLGVISDPTKPYQNGSLFRGNVQMDNSLDVLGGSKLVIQNNQDGGSSKGIYMWNKDDTNWGIYMGYKKSMGNGTACSSNGITGHAIRFRTWHDPTNGFIFENNKEEPLMSINSSTGNVAVKGNLTVGGQLKVNGDLRIKGKIIFETGDGSTSEIKGGGGNIVFTKNNNDATRHGFYMSEGRDYN